ncbi:MAG: hypothetical protein A07HR67_00825 [uncultured archaeon A07HR67]|nr:MAG: hypothetical protein A07HR67_00825 [uncultured archaeon A07HR67]
MTGDFTVCVELRFLFESRFLSFTDIANVFRTALVEPAATRHIDSVAHFTTKLNAVSACFRIGHRYRVDQRLRVWVFWVLDNIVSRPLLTISPMYIIASRSHM